MTRSMTGFGRAYREYVGDRIGVEVSSVNHRFLDCSVRLPASWYAMEPFVKETVRKHVPRGKVTVTVTRKRGPDSQQQTLVYDAGLARQYIEASRELARLLGSDGTLDLGTLAQMDGVFYHEEAEEDLEQAQAVVAAALAEALKRLNAMRETEGEALAAELRHRLGLIREALSVVEQRLPELEAAYEARLRERIAELQADTGMTEDRIAMEIAFMADKGDVTEETVRLKAHLDHAIEMLDGPEPAGRELNFLSQEIQREINTLGSKTHDGSVAREVLRMKSELERLREQIQNIE
ncbi:MAG TPA: YicC family protein [Candidatus Hydrogenedentes bacterium]|nr:YicC family protein [Candidatus Hydrogenedentota bacterium]HRT66450.1 YicC family protein [Candidatus Hydrogenedentota bacterium]